MNNIQSNLITLKDIHTRTELWKDKIYYIAPENYLQWNFPTNNGQKGFLPKPIRFNEIITEFKEAINEQKDAEIPEEDRQASQERIGEIVKDIKEIIQGEIELEEGSGVEFEPGAEITEEDQNWLKDQEKAKNERIKQLKLGLKKQTVGQFRRFNQEHLEDNSEIENLLNEWEEEKKVVLDRKNICFILEDNDQYLKFVYQPPRGIFVNLKDFLFYRNNIWYEVQSWERINHENALITAQRSYFIHSYLKFIQGGANGVIHHSPKFGNKDEICMCPAFLESTEYAEFNSDWQPEYKLFKLKNFMGGTWQTELHNKPYGQDKSYPVFHTLELEEVRGMQTREYSPTTYFLLPEWYENGSMTDFRKFPIKFNNSKSALDEWVKKAKMERMSHDGQGGKYEHLLKHVNVNYFWNSKKIHESTLDEMDWDNFNVIVRANPAGVMYLFQSKKVLFRYSEDLNFSLEADKMLGLAAKMGAKLFDGAIKAISLGTVDPGTSGVADDLKNTTDKYLHNKKGDKSKDERQGERKKTLAAGNSHIAQTTLGTISSILDASHTHGDYSLGEIALRFDSINFWIRLEFNKNLCRRYQLMKVQKKNGNEVFNTKKTGNILRPGYWKIVPNIFEKDPYGYFASIFNQGTYIYEEHPHEYFLEQGETGTFERGILNRDPVITNTTIQENYSSAIGRDDLVHVDDMSWVWKDSYCRPAEGGTDLFPDLINQMRHNIKRDDSNAWKFDGYSSGQAEATLQRGVQYEWFMHAFSSGQRDSRAFRGLDDGVKVILKQDGADWELAFIGRVEITEVIGNPDAIGSGIEIDDVEEILPELEDESQTEGLVNNEQVGEPEAEQQNQQDKEIQEELEQQQEQEDEPEQQKEQEEELEQEDERTKEKHKEKTQERQQEQQQEDEQQEEAEYSGNHEK